MTLKNEILRLLQREPGLTDRQITDRLRGQGEPQQPANVACRQLEQAGLLERRKESRRIRNYVRLETGEPTPAGTEASHTAASEMPIGPESRDLNRLAAIGLVRVGRWVLRNEDPTIELHLGQDPPMNALYAFVADGNVKYVGKTTRGLERRLYGYVNPGPTQSTNIRVRARIADALQAGSQVEVHAWFDSGLHQVGEFRVNMAAGLEDDLVKQLRPEWNA